MTGQYTVAWAIAAALFLVNVAVMAIQATYVAGHGADLGISPQFQAWLAIVSTVIAAALGLLPAVHRTPAVRERHYIKAVAGILPPDLAKKYPPAPPPPSIPTEPPAAPTV